MEDKAVKAVEQATVAGKEVPAVFNLAAALKHGLHEVAQGSEDENQECEHDPM